MSKERKNKSMVTQIVSLVKVVVIAVAVIFVVNKVEGMFNDEPEITNSFISEKLEAASELTTAELTYNGLVRYEDGEIPLLTKKGFSMTYRAEVEAGIDLSEIESKVTDEKIIITLPATGTMDISIAPESIQFYDEKAALFNWSEKEDVVDAQKLAKQDVTEKADIEKLKEKAKEETELLITGLFEEVAGDREIVVEWK